MGLDVFKEDCEGNESLSAEVEKLSPKFCQTPEMTWPNYTLYSVGKCFCTPFQVFRVGTERDKKSLLWSL